ncbi:unnamed protein product [Arctia plantaginis]|uniref:Uncharacterized protein n=1 Tax=Arctia plantaginis TaxID=874455 RepID=A0A8S0ZW67_ARCPL|nr:unnamed protein product [Arctia plantaginis]
MVIQKITELKESNMDSVNMKRATETVPCTESEDQYITESKLRDIVKQEFSICLRSVTNELHNINNQIVMFQESVAFYNNCYEDMKKNLEAKDAIIDQLQADNKRLLTDVVDLTSRLTIVEQHMRDSNLEINGIPEHHNENLASAGSELAFAQKPQQAARDILEATDDACAYNTRPMRILPLSVGRRVMMIR